VVGKAPGGVYLCQVNDVTSCGACCGLYNLPDLSRSFLRALLDRRTSIFASVSRKIAAIDKFAIEESRRISDSKPFAKFHHCPFVGFIGSNRSRVGCLLHPLAEGNEGIDYRGLSYYGQMACRDYFCPATHNLSPELNGILRRLELDWYSYGLIITETALHQALFDILTEYYSKDRISAYLRNDTFSVQWCRKIFTLKLTWPYRKTGKSLCHYFFEDGNYCRPEIDYERLNTAPSRYDTILRELDSEFESKEDLKKAEDLLDQKIMLPNKNYFFDFPLQGD
jgi:hypothetical protein